MTDTDTEAQKLKTDMLAGEFIWDKILIQSITQLFKEVDEEMFKKEEAYND